MGKVLYPVISYEQVLPIYLSGVGIASPEYHVCREQGLVSHQLLFTKSGSGKLIVNGQCETLQVNSCMYLPPKVPHEYYPATDEGWETYWVVFRGTQVDSLMNSLGFHGPEVRTLASTETLQHIFRRIQRAAEDSMGGGYTCSGLLYQYVLEARRLFFEPAVESFAGSILGETVKRMEEELDRDWTLQELAELSGVSKQHFCRVFQERLGMRPMEFLARKRMQRAKDLLISTNESVHEIGKMLGYANQSYFGAVFRRIEGVSPAEYRRNPSGVVL